MELPSVPLLFYSIPSNLPLLVKVKILVQAVAVDVHCADLVVGRECVIVENPQLKRLVLWERCAAADGEGRRPSAHDTRTAEPLRDSPQVG